MKGLRLAPGLTLPADVVTQTLLVVGKRGSGKSNTAARLVEQLHAVKIPFVVLDPVDTWWGLKAGRDGGPGLEGIYVFGGKHADLPLEPGERSGALIAEVLCEHQLSMVLSVKHLSGRERSGFMVAFAQTLFQKWTGGPLHVVLEEAHELAPQNTQNAKEGEQQMLGAFKRLWKLGRASGIGGTAVTQRPASLSKDITTQSEILVAHRTIGPQDVKAIGEWIKYHGERSDILAELPSLPTGDAYVWGPEFPSEQPIGLRRVSVLLRETYDSASTPKVGERRVEPKELAPADLDRLRAKMTATIERAKAEDPRELKKEIARLKGELVKASKAGPPDPAIVEQHIRAGVTAAMQAEWKRARDTKRQLEAARAYAAKANAIATEIAGLLDMGVAGIDLAIEQLVAESQPAPSDGAVRHAPRVAAPVRPDSRAGARAHPPLLAKVEPTFSSSNGKLSGARLRLLRGLAELEAIGVQEAKREQLSFYAGISLSGGYGMNTLGALRSEGLIDYPRDRYVALTGSGRAAVGEVDPPTSLADLHDRIRRHLSGLELRIFDAVVKLGQGEAYTREQLGEAVGASFAGGYGMNTLGKLRTAGLIDYPGKGTVGPSDLLFPEGLS